MSYTLIQATDTPASATFAALLGHAVALAFAWVERRARDPMLPLGLFSSRPFSVANLASFFLYGGLAGLFFLMPIQLQVTAGYTTLAAGLALLPLTVLTLGLSARGGSLTKRAGPRVPLAAGALISGLALVLATRVGRDASYLTDVLPVVCLIGVGIPLITPPITVTVLSAVPDARAGIASAVSNGVARTAGLVIVAALPLLAGLPQNAASNPAEFDRGFDACMLICAALFVAGGLIVWFGVPRPAAKVPDEPICRHHIFR
ncbi:MFS transporter [Actinomadura sp. 3N508]|uniref:MFS transporter n=1 Tax=Actinomadura sp. 3N508 TaxID=3375153 RepID=UPI00378EF698